MNIYGKSTQVTTTGANLLDPQKYKLGESHGITYTLGESGRVIANETSTGSDIAILGDLKDVVQDGKKYSTNCNCYQLMSDGRYVYTNTFTFDKTNMVSIVPYIQVGKGNTVVNKIYEPIFNEGSTPKPWEPYTGGKPSPSVEYPQEIVDSGDKGSVTVEISNDGYVEKGMRFIGNKKIPLKRGSYLCLKNNNAQNIMNAFVVDDGDLISKLEYDRSDTLYTYCIDKLGLQTVMPSGNIIKSNARIDQFWHNGLIYKIENDGLYLYYSNNNPVHDSDDCYVWFLNQIGNTERPYKSKTITLPTPSSLHGIAVSTGGNYTDETGQQWICDEIDLERGKYVQRIGIVYDKISNLNLNFATNSNGTKLFVIADVATKMKAALMCNMLRYGNTQTDNQAITTERGSGGKIYFTYHKANDIEDLKTYIGENVINILYELPEPIEHDLPPEVIEAYKQLRTNYPVTTVLNDSGTGMKVKYVADTKLYIDNKFAELNQSIINTQKQLL